MSNPDFVDEVLTYLTDGSGAQENWDTSNFDPQPRLIDGDEMRDDSDDSRVTRVDLIDANAITVTSAPTGTNEPIGTEFDYRVRRGVSVMIEGIHQDGGGQIADKDDFGSLVTEARRAILAERKHPVGDMTHLTIEQENDESPIGPPPGRDLSAANYFRYDFDVFFEGYESLP